MSKVSYRETFWRKKGGRIMNGKNLQFVRDASIIHDELMGMASESMTKDAVIGITGIIGEHEQNYRIMSRRLDKVQDEILILQTGIKELQEGIKKIAAAVGVVL